MTPGIHAKPRTLYALTTLDAVDELRDIFALPTLANARLRLFFFFRFLAAHAR